MKKKLKKLARDMTRSVANKKYMQPKKKKRLREIKNKRHNKKNYKILMDLKE